MKYEKGTRVEFENEVLFVMDEFTDNDGSLTVVCGAGGEFVYIPEAEVKLIQSSNEDKIMGVLVDMATTMTRLNQNIESIQNAIFNNGQCNCDDSGNDECSNCPSENESKLN